MTGKELYPLVYRIVKRAQKENNNLRKFIDYYEWSMRIPNPIIVSDELADALCTSVSSSHGLGLEIFYQEKVFLKDLKSTRLSPILDYLLSKKNSEGESFKVLGEIIREVFKGRKIPNEIDNQLLRTI